MKKQNSQNPETKYPQPPFKTQPQSPPGETKLMDPIPDHGEQTYVGHGLMEGKSVIITGADSGIGRAVAIAMAREGADIPTLLYSLMQQVKRPIKISLPV